MSSELGFYAMPDEQCAWLKWLFQNRAIWCLVDDTRDGRKCECHFDGAFVDDIDFTKPLRGSLQFYIGLVELSASPVWRQIDDDRRDIDVIRSHAICFDPAMTANGKILLKGQIAIMRKLHYEEAGLDPKPIRDWFRFFAKRLRQSRAADATVVCRLPDRVVRYDDVLLTSGAVEWCQAGGMLKQFVDGRSVFDIQLSNA